MTTSLAPSHASTQLPARATPTRAPAAGQISDLNLAARQRMLSQRMVMQTLLAANGDARQLDAARSTFQLFCDSHARLLGTIQNYDVPSAQRLRAVYEGTQGVNTTIQTFIDLMRTALEHIANQSRRTTVVLESIVDSTDAVLEALNAATTAFDVVTKAKADLLFKELSGIVSDIHTIAREAKVVSFNAQVMAARAGQQGREFAVVANVLSGISTEIDGLSRKAIDLADRNRQQA
ncbi:type IV pili methyl-accepting chemotaxis transducer N-terminal domain-containing protein [Rhodoferax saidenbachensis]|uniref:Methyl-accepting chemotaxis protein n=1 Tax=Rhodoferax saidenbachensis TaxID=1484693 RepID=A0ABU1ZQ73_9BURK|nr:type IV pili methyl-accepting chemotaxis transducer N-terminal domain-containing protein [Rhodoferax saidenbachensis]MDR7307707.1 methyl-accepting chemotaxis protein [Rhodoferax saidenbachensis]